MSLEKYAHIYYDAESQLTQQLLNVQNALQARHEYELSHPSTGLERNLKLIQLSDKLYYEQNLYDERYKEVGSAGLDVIEELNYINHPIGEKLSFDLPDNRYFEILLEDERTVKFLGPYSRA